MRAAMLWNELERAGIPGVVGAWSHEAGGGRFFNVISIKQMYPGHAKQVGHATATVHAGAYANRYVVVVDDDIDPTDTNEVIWAMCTRTDVIEDVDVIKRMWSTSLDPMAYAGDEGPRYYNNRMVIDACRPYDRIETFPPVVRQTKAEADALRARWPELFTPDGKVRKDVKRAGKK
jgi:UbiD family decarboxylase